MRYTKWDEISDGPCDITPQKTAWFPGKKETWRAFAPIGQLKYAYKGPPMKTKPKKKISKKQRAFTQFLKATYKIGFEEYQTMLRQQGGGCAICGKKQADISYRLHVDHNHSTGQVRGLLCAKCNMMVGLVESKEPTIKQIRKYLKKYAYQKQFLRA